MSIEYILESIEENVPNVTDKTYERALTRGMRRFFKESEVWRFLSDPIPVGGCNVEYEMFLPKGVAIVRFAHVYLDGSEIYSASHAELAENDYCPKYDRRADKLVLFPKQEGKGDKKLRIDAVLQPKLGFDELPQEIDYYLDKYADAIVASTCASLLKMPNKNWTNNNAAGIYETQYLQEVEAARLEGKGFDESRILVARPTYY